jgi:hypothetical protein
MADTIEISSSNVPNKKQQKKKLTTNEIKDKLVGYQEFNKKDIYNVKLGTSIRYFSLDKRTKKDTFKTGGILVSFNKEKRFFRLKNPVAKITWSVQLNAVTKIYKKDVVGERKKNDKIATNVKKIILEDKNDPNVLIELVKVFGEKPSIIERNLNIINEHYDGDINNLILESKEVKKKYNYLLGEYKKLYRKFQS